MLAGEVLVFGGAAHDELLTRGAVSDPGGCAAAGVCSGPTRCASTARWRRARRRRSASPARALATLVYAAEDAAAWLEPARVLVGAGARAAA